MDRDAASAPFALVSTNVLPREVGVPSSVDRTYSLRDEENGLALSYEQDGQILAAVFRAHALDDTTDGPIVRDNALCAAGLAVPARVVVPLVHRFELSECWHRIVDWGSTDLSASVAHGVLVVESTTSLRNAMHAALVLSAAGGVFDNADFMLARPSL